MTLSAADFCQTSQGPGVHCPTLFWPRCPQNQLFKTSVFCFSESENMLAIATDIFYSLPHLKTTVLCQNILDSKTHLTVQEVSVTTSRRFAMMAILLAFHD